MTLRHPLGYVVEINGPILLINLLEDSRGYVAGHRDGMSTVEQPGDLIGIEAGAETIILRILTVAYAEPREVHRNRFYKGKELGEPLRQLKGLVIGILSRKNGNLEFEPQDRRHPVLGASVFPLSDTETLATIGGGGLDREQILLGSDTRNREIKVQVRVNDLLGRHFAVLGATGQGKTHFIAALLQRFLIKFSNSRIVVFDVNGEYSSAFSHLSTRTKETKLGGNTNAGMKIPYYALGRHGLARLLLPSERAQLPALRFAIEHLKFVEANSTATKATGSAEFGLYDDCNTGIPELAHKQLEQIRSRNSMANEWPHMRALSCLATEWYVLKKGRNGMERDAFLYGHIQPLVNRIRGLIEDPQFSTVVEINGGQGIDKPLSMQAESARLVDNTFGERKFKDNDWNIHIVDLSRLTQDLMPFVLGSLLEMYAEEIFTRGPGRTHPTMLVLEEAHHYLRQLPVDSDTGRHALAYERLSKEGRKFGLSLLISTQRPSEVSPTVLAQCGTWAVFRLSNDSDQRSVAAASESIGIDVTRQLSGLGRGESIVFGAALPLPIRLCVVRPDPEPDSNDPPFLSKWDNQTN